MKLLNKIQQNLKAPKNQYNDFGGYKYRSCEDILEAVKPMLGEASIVITDDVIEVAGKVYVKATVTLIDGDETISATALAREEENLKGMIAAQITGGASSYARKYALNGLFLIDDSKDPDATNKHEEKKETKEKNYPEDNRPWLTEGALSKIIERIKAGEVELKEKTQKHYRMRKEFKKQIQEA